MMHLRSLIVGVCLVFATSSCAVNVNVNDTQLLGTSETDQDRILDVLMTQQEAWNAGDIDGFMSGYWVSPELRFASGGTVTKGWQATRDRYHENYSDRRAMGHLTFADFDITMLESDVAVVHGAWTLDRSIDRASGLFTLIFRNIDGDWKIVSDTTTSAD